MSDGPRIRHRGRPRHATIPRELLRNAEISRDARLLWAAIEDYSNGLDDAPWPSQATLAECLGATDRSIRNWLNELARWGWIEVERRPGKSSLHWLIWDNDQTQPRNGGSALPRNGGSALPRNGRSYEEEPLEEEPLEEPITCPAPDGTAHSAAIEPAKPSHAQSLAKAVVDRYGQWADQPPPKVSKEAVRAADLLLRRGPTEWSNDPRPIEPAEVRAVLDWIYSASDFWPAQIQSATALRRHWLKLTAAMVQGSRRNGGHTNGAEMQALADELKGMT